MINIKDSQKPILVSILLHIIVLIVLGWSFITPFLKQSWYQFDFATLNPLKDLATPSLQNGNNESPSKTNTTTQAKNAVTQPESTVSSPSESKAAESQPIEEEIIDRPSSTPSKAQTRKYAWNDNPFAQDALRGLHGEQAANNGSVSIEVKGGRLSFYLPAGYKHSLGESGSVTLQFKVDQYARPIANTIEPIKQTGARFFNAAKKVLLDGTLSFDGAPEPGVSCQITIEFL